MMKKIWVVIAVFGTQPFHYEERIQSMHETREAAMASACCNNKLLADAVMYICEAVACCTVCETAIFEDTK